jgi:acetylornithine/N-succinyldiaminopimelate aminotransferase
LAASLDAFAKKLACVAAHRGLGLIRGLELTKDVSVGEITKKALAKGLLIISAGSNVLRFVPPLIITKEDVDEAMAILEECI